MDVDFIYDTDNKIHTIEFDGDHRALANFLNTEMAPTNKDTSQLNTLITLLETHDGSQVYSEWTLSFDQHEVMIVHNTHLVEGQNNKASEADSVHTDLNDMSWEYEYACGKLDLNAVLLDWVDFIQST